MDPSFTARLLKEKKLLSNTSIPGINTEWTKDPPTLTVTIQGPENSLYQHGTFKFLFSFDPGYPEKAPGVRCLTRIYHPNIDTNGGVCVNGLTSRYSKDNSIAKIVMEIVYALEHPNNNEKLALNLDACKMLNNDPEQFAQIVNQYIYENSLDGI